MTHVTINPGDLGDSYLLTMHADQTHDVIVKPLSAMAALNALNLKRRVGRSSLAIKRQAYFQIGGSSRLRFSTFLIIDPEKGKSRHLLWSVFDPFKITTHVLMP